jgi:hypothetical protein
MRERNYAEQARQALIQELGETNACESELLDLYVLLVLTRGEETTLEDVHDSWAVWRSNTNPDHKSLIPFDGLTTEVQEYDLPYRDAIIRAARPLFRAPFGK